MPRTGHDCWTPEVWPRAMLWLLDQHKVRDPGHVAFATFTLRHSSAYWVAIEQIGRYGERAAVDAGFGADGHLTVRTTNVRTLALGPRPKRAAARLHIDGVDLGSVDLTTRRTFRRDESGLWSAGSFDLARQKRPGSSGAIADLFFDGTVLVPGTTGSAEESFFAAVGLPLFGWRPSLAYTRDEMDEDHNMAGMPTLHRQARRTSPTAPSASTLPPSLQSLPPRSVPETRPTPLQDRYINLSVIALICGAVAISAVEIGAGFGSPVVKLCVLVAGPILIITTADAGLRIWRSAWAWMPVNPGRGLFRLAWLVVTAVLIVLAALAMAIVLAA